MLCLLVLAIVLKSLYFSPSVTHNLCGSICARPAQVCKYSDFKCLRFSLDVCVSV